MNVLIEMVQNLTNPDWIMQYGGLYLVTFIVFAETGLFVGFFLPGDTLLFITGMIIANTLSPMATPVLNLLYWVLLISAAGIVGNYIGYWFGRKSGDMLFQRKDSWIFKKRHLYQAKEFYEKKGGGAIVLARFLPIVRTFAPIIAGVVGMDKKKFSFYNIVGSFAWVGSIVSAGFLLGDNPWVQQNLEKIILLIVVVTTAPVIIKALSGRKKPMNVATIIAEVKEEQTKENKH
ncbi:MAG TPA: VTT domain-containing protein [Flavipsychrobacter sp.]|nr:VTT domain-containing protein [Flavipsychrobacter sp.]